jgi:hypothetical protein
MELGLRVSCVKTSEFREGGLNPTPRYATGVEAYDVCILLVARGSV